MKKYVCLIIIAITLCLSGCNCYENKTVANTESKNQSLDHDGVESLSSDYGVSIVPSAGEVPLPTFSNISDYNKFISTTDLPEDFVYYDDLKEFGTFRNLVILSNVRKDGYSNYLYSFYPSEKYSDIKYSFYLYVDRDPWKNDVEVKYPQLTNNEVDTSDLTKLDSPKSGKYSHENLEYWFIKGQLDSIKWKSGDWYYTLSFSKNFNEAFEQSAHINISKLFNTETAIVFISSVSSPQKIK